MRRKKSRLRFIVPAIIVGVTLYLIRGPLQHSIMPPPVRIPPISDPARDAYSGLQADFRAAVPLIEFASMFQRMKDIEGGEAPRLLDAQATEPAGTEPLLARIRVEESADKAAAEYEFARIEGVWKLQNYMRGLQQRPSPAPAPQPAESSPPKPVERKVVPTSNSIPLPSAKAAGGVQPSSGNWPRSYVIQPGDTLETISRQVYGTNRYWHRILEANPGLDPKHLKIGRRIAIPAPPEHPPEHAAESEPAPETAKH